MGPGIQSSEEDVSQDNLKFGSRLCMRTEKLSSCKLFCEAGSAWKMVGGGCPGCDFVSLHSVSFPGALGLKSQFFCQ